MLPQDVIEALEGKRGEDQKRIAETGLDWLSTILKKNSDYGTSVWKRPVLAPKCDPGEAILVRMSDKIERLGQLLTKQAEVKEESFLDTVKDLGAYCLLLLARPKQTVVQEKIGPIGYKVTMTGPAGIKIPGGPEITVPVEYDPNVLRELQEKAEAEDNKKKEEAQKQYYSDTAKSIRSLCSSWRLRESHNNVGDFLALCEASDRAGWCAYQETTKALGLAESHLTRSTFIYYLITYFEDKAK